MSGPKKSKAQLRREEQERIRKERERQLALKKKREEERLRRELEEKLRKERIARCKNILNNYVVKIEALKKNLNIELQNYSRGNPVQSDSASNATYNKALSIKNKTEKYSESVKHIGDDVTVLEKNISEAKDILDMYTGLEASLKNESISNQKEYATQLNNKLNQLFNCSGELFLNSNDYRKLIPDLEARLYWGKIADKKLSEFVNQDISTELLETIRSQFESLAKATDFMAVKLFVTNQIPKIENKVAAEIQKRKEMSDVFNSLYSDYVLLCEECGIEKSLYSISEDSIKAMAKEINKMNSYLQAKSEKEAIKKAIDEVMEELGYPVLATKYLSGEDGENCKKLLVQYADDKAVDVTITDNGQITMEIGIMDNEDRVPTPDEAAGLCSDMQQFCNDYRIIEQKLEEKGLIFSDRNFLPPTAAYAEIINVSEYGLEVEFSEEEKIGGGESAQIQNQKYMQEEM